jgi:hypothetical protein
MVASHNGPCFCVEFYADGRTSPPAALSLWEVRRLKDTVAAAPSCSTPKAQQKTLQDDTTNIRKTLASTNDRTTTIHPYTMASLYDEFDDDDGLEVRHYKGTTLRREALPLEIP